MDSKEISDTLKEAQEYVNRLESLQNDLHNAMDQVARTFQESEKSIQEVFSNLKNVLINALNKRELHLLDQARQVTSNYIFAIFESKNFNLQIKNESLKPLAECHSIIRDKTESTNKLMNLGNSLTTETSKNLDDFIKYASQLGSLPEVPHLIEVPFISFHYDTNNEMDLKNIVSCFGEVYKIAPVQVKKVNFVV